VETIGSKRSYALIWCMPNNDDDDDGFFVRVLLGGFTPRNPMGFFCMYLST